MHYLNPALHTRRAFLKRSSQLALAGTALPTAINLASIGEAAAFSATDYKALVCVFFYGGNDYANTVVPYDNTNYNKYLAVRPLYNAATGANIGLAQSALTPTLLNPSVAPASGVQYALNPSMTGLAGLFNAGKAAVQLNVGPLVAPLTKTQYNAGATSLIPPKLFSHNDQQSVWQSSSPEGSSVGWGGEAGDAAMANNSNSLFTCMSITGNSVFLSGQNAIGYQVSSTGAIKANALASSVYGSTQVRDALLTITRQTRTHQLQNEYNKIMQRAYGAADTINNATTGVPAFTTTWPTDSLANQLKMVAKIIAARTTLGNKRQVFMVSIGGFDLHDFLINKHGGLLSSVSAAMTAFYNTTVELGIADKVTTFTASDFGRTLVSNGDGSDHGWGSHHFVVGGAVNGAKFYGTPPPVSVGSTSSPDDQWHVGQGRLLPSTSVDQYAATLAKWFGVTETELDVILPNLGNFGGTTGYARNMGFV